VARSSRDGARRSFYALVGLAAAVAFLYWARAVLMPVALALLLSFALGPLVNFLQRRGLGRLPSVVVVVVFALAVVFGVGQLVWIQVGRIAHDLPTKYHDEINRKLQAFRTAAAGPNVWTDVQRAVDFVTGELSPVQPPSDKQEPAGAADHPIHTIPETTPWARLATIAGPSLELIVDAALVVVLLVFMLAQRESLRNRLLRLTGPRNLVAATRALDEGANRVSSYLMTQLFINIGFGTVLGVVLFLLGTGLGERGLQDTALFWGFLAALARYVPYLGTWVAGALLFVFCVAALPGWGMAFLVFGIFAVMEFFSGNFLEPMLYGNRIGSSPLALLLAAAFWTFLWGPVGLLLSTPLTVVMVVLGKYVPPLEFLSVVLGDEEVLTPATTFYQRLVARDHDEAAEVAEQYLKEHSRPQLYEDVLLPALSRMREDLRDGELEEDGAQFVVQGTRALIDDLADHKGPVRREGPVVVAVPTRDEADELALRMFRDVLEWTGHEMQVAPTERDADEMLTRLADEKPLILVGSLGPGGLAQTRAVVRRLRSQHPHARLVVGRWGGELPEAEVQRLKAAGADQVSSTMHETRTQLAPSPIPDEPADKAAERAGAAVGPVQV
jgi:predicted PurR-regulated permease PerM